MTFRPFRQAGGLKFLFSTIPTPGWRIKISISTLIVMAAFLFACGEIHAANILVEPDFTGFIGDTISFTSNPSLNLHPGAWDDGSALTYSDSAAYRFALPNGISISGVSFSFPSSASDYAIAFPGPDTYQMNFYRDVTATLASDLSTVNTSFLLDTRQITLSTVPEPSTLGLLAFGMLALGCCRFWLRRKSAGAKD